MSVGITAADKATTAYAGLERRAEPVAAGTKIRLQWSARARNRGKPDSEHNSVRKKMKNNRA